MSALNAQIAAIDAAIQASSSPLFGIKFGGELYNDLAKAGKISWAIATIEGTGVFPIPVPAYDGKYAAWSDWTIGDYEFKLGAPDK